MNARELYTKLGNPAGVWHCSQCRLVFREQQDAEECCTCRFCGKVIEDKKSEFTGYHKDCWYLHDQERTLEKLAKAELVENYDGKYVFLEGYGSDGYIPFDSLQEDLEQSVDSLEDWPEFVFCCEKHNPSPVDIDSIIESFCDSLYEDAADDVTIPKTLVQGIKDFNEANKHLHTYYPDYSRKVKVGPAPEWLSEKSEDVV